MKKCCVGCGYKDSCKNNKDNYKDCPTFCLEYVNEPDVTLTDWEVEFVRQFLDDYFLQMIREDENIDSMLWVYRAMQLYKKVGGLKQYSDYEGD